LGKAVRVWRSGVGVDAHGNVLYAGANGQTARGLAEILQRAGAVRAMELDINSEWVTFNFYGTWGAGAAQKLLPDSYLDVNNWGKGLAFINGFNLGWYWPSKGPANTM